MKPPRPEKPSHLVHIHETLQDAYNALFLLRADFGGASADTCFAIGEALGTLAKAKALVGRDIDDAKAKG